MNGHLKQMEFVANYPQNTKVELTGKNLTGDIDFMHRDSVQIYPTDKELKSIVVITTEITTADTAASTVEASTELIIQIYNYEQNLDISKIYGLFCYGTIFNYMLLTNAIIEKDIKHDEDVYKPTVIVPSFEEIRPHIIENMRKAYGDS